MKKLNQQLNKIEIPVSSTEWRKLKQLLDRAESRKTRPFSFLKKTSYAVAATLLMLIAAYLVFQWPAGTEYGITEMEQSDDLKDKIQLKAENATILSHRSQLASNNLSHTHGAKGATLPYFASLPNGEQWLVHLSLIRDQEYCTASILSINDKPMQMHLQPKNPDCIEFLSKEKRASIILREEGNEQKILLVLHHSLNGGASDQLALELSPVY